MADIPVPVLNIPWIRGVLADDNSRPKLGIGDEVLVVDHEHVKGKDKAVGDEHIMRKCLSWQFTGDGNLSFANLGLSAPSDVDAMEHLSIDTEEISLPPSHKQLGFTSHNKPGFTPIECHTQDADISIVDNPTVDKKQKENQDGGLSEHELRGFEDKKAHDTEAINEDDLDPGCLCASIAVIDIILRERESAMHRVEAFLGKVHKDGPQSLSTQYSMSWIGKSLDRHTTEDLELLETDLAEKAARNPRGEHSEHPDAEMEVIMEYHILKGTLEIFREVQRITIVKELLEMMLYHEYLASEQSSSSTFSEYITELRWSDSSTIGLQKRFENLLNHRAISGHRNKPDNTVGHYFRKTSPTNVGGKYSEEGLEMPLERWGGLESLLHIREEERIMQYLVNSILWLSATYVVTKHPIRSTELLTDIELSAEEREIVEKIWQGEKQEENVTVEQNRCQVQSSVSLDYGCLALWILKAVRKRPDTSLAGKREFIEDPEDHIIEVSNKDFYRLYHKYIGEAHPDDHGGKKARGLTSSPMDSDTQDPVAKESYKRHVLLDINDEDWADMVQKYRYDAKAREQDFRPFRGVEALQAILGMKKLGIEWDNNNYYHIHTKARADDGGGVL